MDHAALDEERRAHTECDVERRHEAEVEPVGALERDPFTERSADTWVGTNTHLERVGCAWQSCFSCSTKGSTRHLENELAGG